MCQLLAGEFLLAGATTRNLTSSKLLTGYLDVTVRCVTPATDFDVGSNGRGAPGAATRHGLGLDRRDLHDAQQEQRGRQAMGWQIARP